MEYRSATSLLGVPLVHIAIGPPGDGRSRRGIASGWIAIGDVAFGVLFAAGGLAFGGISFGGLSLGLLSLGGLAIGLAGIGGLAVGLVAVGGAAFGWHLAFGGFAIAHDLAGGGYASADRLMFSPGALPPWSAIPHHEFLWTDAALLILLAGAMLAVVAAVHFRRGKE